jgi:(p)ppGpp synthase/HD superfamily hydrolase
VWLRFNAGRDDQLWFYRAFVGALRRAGVTCRLEALIEELEDVVAELELLAEGGGFAHALAISAWVHANQRDKAGAPYALHPIRMMMRLDTDEARIAALLHDVIEDIPGWSGKRLRREGFCADVVAAVEALTKREGEDYDAFIRRAAVNPIALRVKQMDLEDNLNLLRLSELRDQDIERIKKYHRHWLQLVGEASPQYKKE